jgi:nucleosome assembly protein 1-like 1
MSAKPDTAVAAADSDDEQQMIEKIVAEKVSKLPASAQQAVKELEELANARKELFKKFLAERRVLEAKYEQEYQPLYEKRAAVVSGSGDSPAIENFWLECLNNHPHLASSVQEQDEPALAFLKDIKCNVLEDGYELLFVFNKNPFFDNDVLRKRYVVEEDDEGDQNLIKAEGTEIQWQAGKNLTQKMVTKKQRHKSGKGTRTVTRAEPCDSFFNFFKPPQHPAEGDDEDDEDEGDAAMLMETDFEMGEAIRYNIVPQSVDWFTGRAAAEAMLYGDDDEDDDEDGDDDDDEDDEDDDDEEDEAPKRGGKSKPGKQGGAAPQFQMGGADQKCEKGQQ